MKKLLFLSLGLVLYSSATTPDENAQKTVGKPEIFKLVDHALRAGSLSILENKIKAGVDVNARYFGRTVFEHLDETIDYHSDHSFIPPCLVAIRDCLTSHKAKA